MCSLPWQRDLQMWLRLRTLSWDYPGIRRWAQSHPVNLYRERFRAAWSQRNGSMMERSNFAGLEHGGRKQLLEDGEGKETILLWSLQKEHRLFSPGSSQAEVPFYRVVRNKTQKHQKNMRRESVFSWRNYWYLRRVANSPESWDMILERLLGQNASPFGETALTCYCLENVMSKMHYEK